MINRILSVSSAPYDGYDFPVILESLASCGVEYVEPAFIVGYMEPFGEEVFLPERAVQYMNWLEESGLKCHAFSSHIDLGHEDAVDVFKGRMDFAAHLGARIINTNAVVRKNEKRFLQNIGHLLRHAEKLDMAICLENPGDGSDNLINVASDGKQLIQNFGNKHIRLNYDAGNTISHRPEGRSGGVNPCQDALDAMHWCGHVHIKDVQVTPEGYFFTPLGEGVVGCAKILDALTATDLNVSIEIPMRLHRGLDSQPVRRKSPVPLPEIEVALLKSIRFVQTHLGLKL